MAPPKDTAADVSEEALGATRRVLDELRAMLIRGDLLPGQQLRQAQLAKELKVSRVPVREALAAMLAEGTVVHVPNIGYTVARFSADDLRQIYLMRDLLESALLKQIKEFPPEAIRSMTRADEEMRRAARRGDVMDYLRHNREFHFIGFRLARMNFVLATVERLWNVSDFYRSLYLYDQEVLTATATEHGPLIALAARQDIRGFIRAVREHRSKGAAKVEALTSRHPHPLVAR